MTKVTVLAIIVVATKNSHDDDSKGNGRSSNSIDTSLQRIPLIVKVVGGERMVRRCHALEDVGCLLLVVAILVRVPLHT